MNNSQGNTTSSGRITSGISHNLLSAQTTDFIYDNLASWRDDPHRPKESAEDKLNLQLCKYLDSRARNDFPMVHFNHEEYQTAQRRIDISASPAQELIIGVTLFTLYDPFLVIECKRLPAPSRDREKEYISGINDERCGGIQRFKLGLHGVDLEMVAIIGYIQKHTIQYWQDKINEWIIGFSNTRFRNGCSWDENEILTYVKNDIEKAVGNYRSAHRRVFNGNTLSNIEIHHLWIEM